MSRMAALEPLEIPPAYKRATSTVLPPLGTTPSFVIDRKNKSYKHQYSNIYFVRLKKLREALEKRAKKRWEKIADRPTLVPRILDIVKSHLCYIIGTVYMDMPLKPNVIEEIARDQSIPPPPPKKKFYSSEDEVLLEDESGRIRLVGERVHSARLVTGVIISVLGAENSNGDFDVVDICYPDMAPRVEKIPEVAGEDDKMDVDDGNPSKKENWIAVVSGLDIGSSSPSDAQIQMLIEYLTGEEGGVEDQVGASRISRLIVAGNSLAPPGKTDEREQNVSRKARKYGQEAASFSPHPAITLSRHLLDIGSTMPIHVLPGETDPAGVILPQQPFPRAMFGRVATAPSFSCETNPTYLRISCDLQSIPTTRTLLINSGQPLNDMFKYLPSPPNTRLSILESTLRWRHMAPTAPDTLWCHPYFSSDPFIITETPDIYIVGNQKKFGTKLVVQEGEGQGEAAGRSPTKCRIVMVPTFAKSGTLVLVNLQSLAVKTVTFSVEGMTGGGEEVPEPATDISTPDSTQEPPELTPSSTQHSFSSSFV